jgi:hypothetical protein
MKSFKFGAFQWLLSQQPRPSACTGGQGTSPKEQKTQQSPLLGVSLAPQAAH